MVFCEVCEMKVQEGGNYCYNCGAGVESFQNFRIILSGSSVDSKVSLKWLVGSSVDFKVYYSDGSSARQSILTSYLSEVFGAPKVIIIMPQVYALLVTPIPSVIFIHEFTFKTYAFPKAFVMFRKILSGTSKRIEYFT